MTEQKIIIMAAVATVVVVCTAVVYVNRKKVEQALRQPKETLLFLMQEWEEFISQDSTKTAIKRLCRLADKLVTGDGADRLAFVCGHLYKMVPDYLQNVITIEKLQEIVNLIYSEIKVYIDGHWVAGE